MRLTIWAVCFRHGQVRNEEPNYTRLGEGGINLDQEEQNIYEELQQRFDCHNDRNQLALTQIQQNPSSSGKNQDYAHLQKNSSSCDQDPDYTRLQRNSDYEQPGHSDNAQLHANHEY